MRSWTLWARVTPARFISIAKAIVWPPTAVQTPARELTPISVPVLALQRSCAARASG